MVDEYQDTNRLQAQIAALLASEHGDIMVVGDDSQRIITEIVQNNLGFEGMMLGLFADKQYTSALRNLYKILLEVSGSEKSPAENLQTLVKYYIPLLKTKYDDYHKRLDDLKSLIGIAERYHHTEHFLEMKGIKDG